MTSRFAYFAIAVIALPAPLRAQAAPRDTLRIVFVGDINFARSLARNYLFTGRGAEVFAGVRDRLRAADIAVGNLESILLERGTYADTSNSPQFAGPQALAIPLLHDAGFDVIGTANNHAWDFGHAGLIENLRHLGSAGLANTGTGPTVADAWRPVVIRTRGWTVAFFALAAIFNYEDLTVVGHDAECCVAWADTLTAAERFRTVRDSVGADLVVAYVHAGLEYKPYPEPDVVVRFRSLARAGADLVIGHHPHVPQGIEATWDRKLILYSLGNFVFMQRQPWTNRGLWAEVEVTAGEWGVGSGNETLRAPRSSHSRLPTPRFRLSIIPLAVGYAPRFLTGPDSAAVMAHVDSIAGLISEHPRLPIRRPRRNVAPPAQPRTARPTHQ